jgi:hypothetical protein
MTFFLFYTFSSRLVAEPLSDAPAAASRGCNSKTVRNNVSLVVVKKSISAFG